jgi:hypothetical protein
MLRTHAMDAYTKAMSLMEAYNGYVSNGFSNGFISQGSLSMSLMGSSLKLHHPRDSLYVSNGFVSQASSPKGLSLCL